MVRALSRDELEAIVREARHLREEHRRAHVGSRARRRLGAALLEIERDFERLLGEWVAEAATRAAWRAHLHEGAPAPREPAPGPPLVFRGRAGTGSTVEVSEGADGECDVEVDGCLVERIEAELDFATSHAPHTFTLDSTIFSETFSASDEALAALADFRAGGQVPPWRYAAELLADGLIDGNLGLTPRGRRAVAAVQIRTSP